VNFAILVSNISFKIFYPIFRLLILANGNKNILNYSFYQVTNVKIVVVNILKRQRNEVKIIGIICNIYYYSTL